MTLKPEAPRPPPVWREEVARVIASALGDDFDHAFVNKSEWNKARGEKGGRYRDINEPMQDDYLAAADAILALFSPADGWRPDDRLYPAIRAKGKRPTVAQGVRRHLENAHHTRHHGFGVTCSLRRSISPTASARRASQAIRAAS